MRAGTDDVCIIGAGLSGLAAASLLAKRNLKVSVLEKNSHAGGRLNTLREKGFTFDMGPSWYWMPDVFENYFNHFNKSSTDYYTLKRLDPSYRVFLEDTALDIPAEWGSIKDLFEGIEKGSGERLEAFMNQARLKYELGMRKLVFKPGLTLLEYINADTIRNIFKLDIFNSFHKHIETYFRNPILKQLLEFPILFLGASGKHIPSLYSLMNHADMKLGTWYPMGGMNEVAHAFSILALDNGVQILADREVDNISVNNNLVKELTTKKGESFRSSYVLASADYKHIEDLLPINKRSYPEAYWEKQKLSPSCLLFYIGVNKKIPGLLHHNLFFDADYQKHVKEIFDTNIWPESPLFYVCAPSKTDPGVAPEGMENLFILVPVSPGMKDSERQREQVFKNIISRIEKHCNCRFANDIIVKKHFGHQEFKSTYNAFKGNAYGLANTLNQTAFMKPKMKSKKLNNLYFSGQLTNPGPGMPPAIISGEIAAGLILKNFR